VEFVDGGEVRSRVEVGVNPDGAHLEGGDHGNGLSRAESVVRAIAFRVVLVAVIVPIC
jgi:hypothetical protein